MSPSQISSIELDRLTRELDSQITDTVFFESPFTKNLRQNSIATEFVQLNFKKEYKLPVTTRDLIEARDLKNIIRFFKFNDFVSSRSLIKFDQVLRIYLDDFLNLNSKLNQLREEVDKYTLDTDKYGKLAISWNIKAGKIRINLERLKLSHIKQSIALSINPHEKKSLVIFTQDSSSSPWTELLKLRTCSANSKRHSILFDSQVWQSFNQSGIHSLDYLKSLECIERNHLCMKSFVKEVNKKELINCLRKDLISQISLRTNNKDRSLISFVNNSGQHIEAQVSSLVSSLRISK